jgi:hypothetical protein
MPEITEWNPEDPRKIYEALMQRCKEVKAWYIRCLVDEAWTGFNKSKKFEYRIEDGIVTFKVVAFTHRQAMLEVVNNVPVLKFLDEPNE